MDELPTKCNSCGGPLDAEDLAPNKFNRIECPYCGTSITLPKPVQVAEVIRPADVVPPSGSEHSRRNSQPKPNPNPRRSQSFLPFRIMAFMVTCMPMSIFMLIFGVMFCGMLGIPAALLKSFAGSTEQAFEKGELAIAEFAESNERLPTDAEARKLLRSERDRWGNPLQYEQEAAAQYRLRSLGRDKEPMSHDDEIRDFREAKVSSASSSKVFQFASLNEAFAALESPGSFPRKSAIQWFESNEPSGETDAHVLSQLLDLPNRQRSLSTVKHRSLLERWVRASDTPVLLEIMNDRKSSSGVLSVAIDLYKKHASPEELLALYNHPQRTLRAGVRPAVKESMPQERVFQQCYEDLNDVARREFAIDQLETMPLTAENEAKLRATLKTIFDSRLSGFGKKEFALAKRILDREDFEIWMTIATKQMFLRDQAAAEIAEMLDDEMLGRIVNELGEDTYQQREVIRLLTSFGADKVEEPTLLLLRDGSMLGKTGAIQVLGNIKSQRALELLRPLTTDPASRLRIYALRAIQQIEAVEEAADK